MHHCLTCSTVIETGSDQHYAVSNLGQEFTAALQQRVGHDIQYDELICQNCFESLQDTLTYELPAQKCLICSTVIETGSDQHYPVSNLGQKFTAALQQRVGRHIQDDEMMCQHCFESLQDPMSFELPVLHDHHVCVWCRNSLFRCRTHDIPDGPVREIVSSRIYPRQIPEGGLLCYTCWVRFASLVPQQSPRVAHNTNICIWCSAALTHRRSHALLEGPEWDDIARRIHPRQIPAGGRVCYACWVAAQRNVRRHVTTDSLHDTDRTPDDQAVPDEPLPDSPNVRNMCVWCRSSLLHRMTHILGDGPQRNHVAIRVFPRIIPHDALVCMTCWRNLQVIENVGVNVEPEMTLQLDDYTHTTHSSAHCFVPGCTETERLNVPKHVRKRILISKKVFVTDNAKICEMHVSNYDWDILDEHEFSSTFTKNEIQTLLKLSTEEEENTVPINFTDIRNISDNIFRYWTGVTKSNYEIMFNGTPSLQQTCKRPRLALGLQLVKLRTGESHDRIASLFQISKGLVCLYLKKARVALEADFILLHLGLNHISRNDIVNKNLLIPEGLFGDNESKPIIICDGTYIYVQKSSNYHFQKITYSLHKYRNLIKPFLLVSTDGHIIDAIGPFPATTSDADIMKLIFEDNIYLQYFRAGGDVFILDRGFRDAIPLLRSLNFAVHKPESLDAGETQLSTIKANKTRCVTLVRWVVEVVNGRFKRDFRLLRHTYFNVASRHLFTDFKIAAAIINAFHPVIEDRSDAQIILNRALSRVEMPNLLSQYIIENNINRRRADFVNINNVEGFDVFPQMTMNDLELFALGTYQIKQARSYYGEHIRQHGSFVVEISTSLEVTNIPELASHDTQLIRGRIKSRHYSNKIYYVYIFLDTEAIGWENTIAGYYCSCISGKRTVGTCAHVMTIIWYFGWARHQEHISAPASFLDGILILEDD